MANSQPTSDNDIGADVPAPASLSIKVNGEERQFSFEQAYVVACSLLERDKPLEAAKLFHQLEQFTDRGPRALIMGAFCDAASRDYGACSARLSEAFKEDRAIAGALHDAFISINVGIRKEGIQTLAQLVDEHKNLPSLCLLLGDILQRSGDLNLARRCWALAVQRDRPKGAVAIAATRQLQTHSSNAD